MQDCLKCRSPVILGSQVLRNNVGKEEKAGVGAKK
jgi:hypothetical protein